MAEPGNGEAQHFLELDPTLQCVFLYGVFGPESELYLTAVLHKAGAQRERVLEVLNWLGTERSVDAVHDALLADPTRKVAERAVGYFMRLGGPRGRKALLDLDLRKLPPDSRSYLAEVRKDVERHSIEEMMQALEKELGKGPKLADDEVRRRLRRMQENNGRDDDTHPMSIVNSTVPKDELLASLALVRSRTLHRLSDEALSEVQMTNLVMNAVQYVARPGTW